MVRALIHYSNVPIKLRYKWFKEDFNTDKLMDGIDVIDINGKKYSIYRHRFGRNPDFLNHLRIWLEAVTININTYRTPKV